MNIQRSFQEDGKGKLYVVATPIGNLADVTQRSLDTLREVDVIACEDTRQTRKLLTHFQIDKRLVSYHEHNKEGSGAGLMQWLAEGKQIALVSDAGMPAISDPGADLVRDATEAGYPVIPVPGANAALAALVASGLPTDRFVFVGFLPREKKDRSGELERLRRYPETLLIYEAPHRLTKTLEDMLEAWGDRRVAVARELTKRYEEFVRGTLSSVLVYFQETVIRGEFVIVVEGYRGDGDGVLPQEEVEFWAGWDVVRHVDYYVQQGMTPKEAVKRTAQDRGENKRDVYQIYHRVSREE